MTMVCRAISHDENKYPNPEVFMPERFLRRDGTLNEDKVSWIFGFGRRIWYVNISTRSRV